MEKFLTILVPALALLVFMVWKEIRRKNSAHLMLRLLASTLAVASLIIIALPVSYQRKIDTGKPNTALILTSGYDRDSISDLRNIPGYTTDVQIAEKNRSVKLIPDLASLIAEDPAIKTFHIAGYGLETWELNALKNREVIYHPAKRPEGLIAVNWNGRLRSGQTLNVQGTYHNASGRPVALILKGLGTSLDSIRIPAKRSSAFELKTIPKHLDKAVYSLLAMNRTDTVMNEKIPMIVEEKKLLNILILSSSPDFETKFFKTWLYQNRFALALRTRISKEKYSTEFLNLNKSNLNRVRGALLENFDLLISDMTELSALAPAERQAIRDQVSSGMGLIIKANEESPSVPFFSSLFELRANMPASQETITLNWGADTARKVVLPSGRSLRITPQAGTQVLVRDGQGGSMVSSKLHGIGRILLSTLSDSYTWILGDNAMEYSSYWSYLIENSARPSEASENWALQSAFPIINNEVSLQLEINSDSIPLVYFGNSILKVAQDPTLRFRWTGFLWPSKAGWHSINQANSGQNWLYVFTGTEFQNVRNLNKIISNQKFIQNQKRDKESGYIPGRYYTETVPAICFFILFLLCCTYLWLEAKLL